MYVVDITRGKEYINSDMLVGRDSMDAKNKTLNYIMDYALANHNMYLDKGLLDQHVNMDSFSLNEFMKNNYSMDVKQDLLIQSFPTDKEHCLFVKYFDSNQNIAPSIYIFNKNEDKQAQSTLAFLVNDSLIKKYEDNLNQYDMCELNVCNPDLLTYNSKNINCEIISLYNGGMFLEELLNNACSLYELNHKNYGGIDL